MRKPYFRARGNPGKGRRGSDGKGVPSPPYVPADAADVYLPGAEFREVCAASRGVDAMFPDHAEEGPHEHLNRTAAILKRLPKRGQPHCRF